MKYNLKISVEKLPTSLNITLRSHFFKVNKEKQEWNKLIAYHCSNKKPIDPLQRCQISVTRYSIRLMDYDGLVGSLKPVIDALIYCGIIIDDNYLVTGPWNVDQIKVKHKNEQRLEIQIDEL